MHYILTVKLSLLQYVLLFFAKFTAQLPVFNEVLYSQVQFQMLLISVQGSCM